MNINFSERDRFILSLASKIGNRTGNSDFVGLDDHTIKTQSSKTLPLTMFSKLDKGVGEKFAFYSTSTFLSIIENDAKYDMELDFKKYDCKVKSNGKKYKIPIVIPNEYSDFKELDLDQTQNPIYMASAIGTSESLVSEIKRLKEPENWNFKFKMSSDKVTELMKDARRVKAKVVSLSKIDDKIKLVLSSKIGDDTQTTVEYDLDGEIKEDIEVIIPFFANIFNGDMTVCAGKEDTLIMDTTNAIFYITNTISDLEVEIGDEINWNDEEYSL